MMTIRSVAMVDLAFNQFNLVIPFNLAYVTKQSEKTIKELKTKIDVTFLNGSSVFRTQK